MSKTRPPKPRRPPKTTPDRALPVILSDILARLRTLESQERITMADVLTVKQLVKDIAAETDDVAAKVEAQAAAIQALKDQVAAGGNVTAADLQEIQDGLGPIVARLQALGSDPAVPIPPA
jgi:hypothetical protein